MSTQNYSAHRPFKVGRREPVHVSIEFPVDAKSKRLKAVFDDQKEVALNIAKALNLRSEFFQDHNHIHQPQRVAGTTSQSLNAIANVVREELKDTPLALGTMRASKLSPDSVKFEIGLR